RVMILTQVRPRPSDDQAREIHTLLFSKGRRCQSSKCKSYRHWWTSSLVSKKIYSLPFFHFCRRSNGSSLSLRFRIKTGTTSRQFSNVPSKGTSITTSLE